MSDRSRDADKLFAEGRKLATKTLFRWTEDWEGAAIKLNEAATLYKNQKIYDKAKAAYLTLSEAQYKLDAVALAAKSVESAAQMTKENGNSDESAELYERASGLYRENGTVEKSCECLTKAAKILETSNVTKAVELCMQAIEAFEDEDKLIFSADTYKMAENLLLKNQKYTDAIPLYRKHAKVYESLNQKANVWKTYLTIIVIQLQMDDYVGANTSNEEFLQVDGYLNTDECRIANDLLDAIEHGDSEALQKITKKPIFNFLDNSVARIAKGLKIGEGGVAIAKPISNAAALFGEPKATTVTTTTTTTTTTTETIKTKANPSVDTPSVSNNFVNDNETKFVGLSETNVPVGNSEESSKPISEPKDVTPPEDDDESSLR